jgi:Spy/CpxP family protein refolding chaperone
MIAIMALALPAGAQEMAWYAEEMAQAQEPGAPGGQVFERRIIKRGAGGAGGDVVFSSARAMGPWWKDSEIVNELHLTDAQKKEIEQSFYQYRLQLIDATAAVQKLDTRLDALMNGEYLEEAEIHQVLDQLVVARGQLSRMYAGMLISIRKVLLPEQWKKLQGLQAEKGVMPLMFGAGPVLFGARPGAGPFIRRLPPPPPPNAPVPSRP